MAQKDHRDRRPPRAPDLGNQDQVKRLKRAMDTSAKEVIRCQKCGHQQVAEMAFIGPRSTCPECGAPLHSCKHCKHFDPGTLHQCRKKPPKPVSGKWAANDCPLYEPRTVLDATGRRAGAEAREDPKSLFNSLFKK